MQNKKIVLIVPESIREFEPTVYPPLGILYIAAELEKEKYHVLIHDMRNEDASGLSDIALIPESNLYAITSTTNQFKRARQIIEFLKKRQKETYIVVGGPHASWLPGDFLNIADCVVRGEGEHEIVSIFGEKKKGIINAFATSKKNMINEIIYPARHLIPQDRIISKALWSGYGFSKGIQPEATTLLSSRGCPFECSFCANLPQKVRLRSVENFVGEIKELIENYNCRHYRFLDDNFTIKKTRLYEFRDAVKGLGIHFRISSRSDLITNEVCEILLDSGCEEVGLGIESGDDAVLQMLNKKETVEIHKNAILTLKKYGLRVKAFLMAGLPGETWESIEKTKELMMEAMPDKYICTLFTPYPGSSVWNNPERYNVKILNKDLDDYYQTYPTFSNIETNVCSSEELNEHYEDLIGFLKNRYNLA